MVKTIWQQTTGFRLWSMPSGRATPVTTQVDAGIVSPDYKVTKLEPSCVRQYCKDKRGSLLILALYRASFLISHFGLAPFVLTTPQSRLVEGGAHG